MGFLILHGIENHRPPEHWQFQLAAHLSEAGHRVRYPDLPTPDAPRYEQWAAVLHASREDVVICHSLACLLWFKAAPSLAPVDRLLLVSPPASELVPEAGASFRLDGFDAGALRASAREITVVCSDDDPYNPDGERYGFAPVVIPGAGHITPETGFGRWPAVEEWCASGVFGGPAAGRLVADGEQRLAHQ